MEGKGLSDARLVLLNIEENDVPFLLSENQKITNLNAIFKFLVVWQF